MEELLVQYLMTRDFPLEFRMQLSLPADLKSKIKKCSDYLKANGVTSRETAEKLVNTL
jgi:hypothetical protein